MPSISLTPVGVHGLKSALRAQLPLIKNGHLLEAISVGCGFKTYAALNAYFRAAESEQTSVEFSESAFWSRLGELGYKDLPSLVVPTEVENQPSDLRKSFHRRVESAIDTGLSEGCGSKTGRSPKESIAFCEDLFSRVRGRAQVRINGAMPCFDPTKKEVFISLGRTDPWMPAALFLKHLADNEIDALVALPEWDGKNEISLSITVLTALDRAIARYRKSRMKFDDERASPDFGDMTLLPHAEDYYFYGDTSSPFFTERIEDGVVVRSPAWER